jgi:hypothetical protein
MSLEVAFPLGKGFEDHDGPPIPVAALARCPFTVIKYNVIKSILGGYITAEVVHVPTYIYIYE